MTKLIEVLERAVGETVKRLLEGIRREPVRRAVVGAIATGYLAVDRLRGAFAPLGKELTAVAGEGRAQARAPAAKAVKAA